MFSREKSPTTRARMASRWASVIAVRRQARAMLAASSAYVVVVGPRDGSVYCFR
jgi:hypothetical protein